MDIKKLLADMKDCPCGREHTVDIKAVEVGSGITAESGSLLKKYSFEKKLLCVADKNTLGASGAVLDALRDAGFSAELKLYDNLTCADMTEVEVIRDLSKTRDAIFAIGTGSLHDVCRLAAFLENKQLCLFATAPSMDGFASDTAPITKNNFKMSYQAKQPELVIADTKILADSPARLKAAGFGDMAAKYVGLVDWQVSRLTTGEYYCEKIAMLTKKAADRVISFADRVTDNDEATAEAIMEALVMTGVGMKLARSSRPASGAEHIISHFWEIKKLEKGLASDLHGRKVGVATLACAKIYHQLAQKEKISAVKDSPDWEDIKRAYGSNLAPDMMAANNPTVTEQIDPKTLEIAWPQIRGYIYEYLPTYEKLLELMKTAGAATCAQDIDVTDELYEQGIKYHSYMRHRVTLMRILDMIRA